MAKKKKKYRKFQKRGEKLHYLKFGQSWMLQFLWVVPITVVVNQELNLSGPCVLRILDQLLKYNIIELVIWQSLKDIQISLQIVVFRFIDYLWALSWHCCLLLFSFLIGKVSYPPDKGSQKIPSCQKIGTK